MVWGFVWYGPLFGKLWIKEMGWSDEAVKMGRTKSMTMQYTLQTLGALVMAFVFSHIFVFSTTYIHETGLMAAFNAGFWNWLGFVAPVTLTSVLWDGKSWKLWMLNSGYYLVVLLTMGLIFAYWPM